VNYPNHVLKFLDFAIIIGSLILCIFLAGLRLPGMELAEIRPNWLLIWLVSWSVRRSIWSALFAGLALGWIQEGMTGTYPSQTLGLVVVGVLTAFFRKQRFLKEDFITIALLVFGMTLIADTIMAVQQHFLLTRDREDLWLDYQRIALTSAIISSLWAPVLHYPLVRWSNALAMQLDRSN
jgi:rod shape-determining protein MreD